MLGIFREKMMGGAWIFLALLQATLCLAGDYPPCYSDVRQCTANLKDLLMDNNVFWFGKDFAFGCPPTLLAPECNNPDRLRHNIISRMYNLTDDAAAINYIPENLQVTEVTFNPPRGLYHACGHLWDSPAVSNYMVDPTRVMTIGQWAMDHPPEITWDTSKDPAGTMYTMVVWDSGFYYTHGLYINIQGGNAKLGTTLFPFFGPKVPLLRPNVYVFTVFRQTGFIETGQAFRAYNFVFNENLGKLPLLSFLDPLPIDKRLVAANIMVVPGDAYGLQYQKDMYILNKCPALISQSPALKPLLDAANMDLEWASESSNLRNIPTPYINSLTVDMTIIYTLFDDVHAKSCCNQYKYIRSKFIVDPLNKRSIRSVQAKNRPHIKIKPVNIMGDQYDSFRTKTYTLMLVDIMPLREGGANFVIHWMINDIVGGNVDTGSETLPYVGPAPYERTKPHAYIFMLFEQSAATFDVRNWNSHVSDQCPPFLAQRCGKDFEGLLKAYSLKDLRGLSWFTAIQDGYTRELLYNDYMIMMEPQVCQGIDGYEDPCPKENPSSSTMLDCATGVLLITTIVAIFKQF